ncbi:glycosyl transferase, group 1 [Magnetococcus marinus MC-1]|uniref:Glycosyl transferase, group 1 n=1 Tax=Magnetococcus marinus (strain ATCC BAA-1437 / JCM 17883 / MC-1) TaxID=156889 RepID=A0LAC7_MAGMM|nr:glycosyltransferase family 4 protein [Magnetococcus marinus]ABK44920.1 glycosyl transferase, group 1 [Magnetococcus marinus MC-1]
MIRLAIITSHPIQYNAPFFQCLAQQPGLQLRVFYSWVGTAGQNDPEFGHPIQWDLPLLEGYDFRFVENRAQDPGTHHFNGLNNPTMVAEIQAWQPHVLLVYGWPFRTHLRVLRAFHGRVPILFRGDSNLLASGGFFNSQRRIFPWLRRLVLRWVYGHVDGALPVGQLNDDYFRAFNIPDQRRFRVPHMVDNARFAADHGARCAEALTQRRRLGIDDEKVVLLFAGKFVPHKQPMQILQAVQQANRLSEDRLVLLLVGSGPLQADLQQQALGDKAIFFMETANQQAMPMIYRMGDLLVLPSRNETWGLAVNEAMACQRPALVSSQVGCGPDLIVPGETGWSYPFGQEQQLPALLLEWCQSRAHLAAMGARAYARIQDYSFTQGARALMSALQQMTAAFNRP